MADQETQEMLNEFVSESYDNLDSVEPLIDDIGSEDNSDSVNAIFRAFHTIKGLSGFFEQMVINKVTHQAETFLDLIRKSEEPQPESVINIIYKCSDFIRGLLDIVSQEFTDISAEADAQILINQLVENIETFQSGGFSNESSDELPQETPNVEVLEEVKEDIPEESGGVESFQVGDELKIQFFNSSIELIEITENNLISLEEDPNQKDLIDEAFGSIHSLKGNAGFMGFGAIQEQAADIENILQSVRDGELDMDTNIVSILLSNIEQIKKLMDPGSSPEAETAEQADDLSEKIPELKEESIDFEVQGLDEKNETIEFQETETSNVEITEEKIIVEETKPDPVPEKKLETPKVTPPKAKTDAQLPAKKVQRNDIRVETGKIDKLFDLVGELITIESMIMKSPDLAGLELPSFNKSANMLNKITRELQEISMSIRMMPLEGLFNKMKRLVRDVSSKQGKKVNFTISGQETEMDKNVIDEISDPLVHLLRNACDHGIETPEKREASGKQAEGNISLSAKYEGNEILIIIEDDGAGIIRDVILRKAIEKEIINTDGSELTDSQVFKLIFEAGFSTAAQITDISGRGVGMDVVRKNIEKLRGSIDVHSTPGLGSTFILRIPLTLAIMESMLIKIGENVLALPILSLKESFLVEKDKVNKTMDGLEMVKVRDEIMPVVRLHEFFEFDTEVKDLDKGIMIIIENRNKRVCFFADEIVGQQQAVVKSLSNYIGKVEGLTGCMILGDGGIGLILDVESIIKYSESVNV